MEPMIRARVIFAVALTIALSGFGSASASPLLPSDTPAPPQSSGQQYQQADGLTLLLLGIRREPDKSRPGWDQVTVELGVRNNGRTPQSPSTVNWGGEFAVAEGEAAYSFEIENAATLESTMLPPGFAICGKLEESRADVVVPTAVGYIPSTLRPTKMNFNSFPPVDLTKRPSSSGCAATPPPPDLPKAPVKVPLTVASATKGELEIEGYQPFPTAPFGGLTRLNARIENPDRFGDLNLPYLIFWLIDRDGVVRYAYEIEDSEWARENCEINQPGPLTVPPATTANARACYPYRPGGKPFVVIVQDGTEILSVVRLPVPG
jgi:hypothetical protein